MPDKADTPSSGGGIAAQAIITHIEHFVVHLPAVASRILLSAGSSTMRVNLVTFLWLLFMTSVSAACLLFRPAPHLYNLRLTTNASIRRTGSPLEHVLVGISFHFNRQKLVHLKYVSTLREAEPSHQPIDLTPVVACICELSDIDKLRVPTALSDFRTILATACTWSA